jgi:hypothetical protein
MSNTNQYYFSVSKLQTLINKFSSSTPSPGKALKGFVFVQGFNPAGQSRIFAYPMFGDPVKDPENDDVLMQNTDVSLSSCPYPPGCK